MKTCLGFLLLLLSLSPVSAQKKTVATVRIGMFADLHVPTMHDADARLTTFLDSMKTARPDFIIELGDFGTPAEKYRSAFDRWNAWPGPKYHLIGNHEMDGGYSLEQALAYRNMPSSYYAFMTNGFHFIVLDGNDKKFPEQKGYQEHIGPKQLAWLREELGRAQAPIVIFSHQGLGLDGVDNAAEIRTLLETHNATPGRPRIIANFYGHIHYDRAEQVNGIWYICINSMSYKWLGEEYGHVRYSPEVDKNYKWIKYTAPYKDPLFTVVEISGDGRIRMSGKKTEWVGPSPWQVGYPEKDKAYIVPEIRARELRFIGQ
ncbi:metallophosphoesterase family protein [Larkinella soli]|uniref:metallophosphoesterase family protein n=1 Tax=Larkinella soli TaxID=1770527 RepID=UPI000FFB528F|nr:metallophosphoesterase [Larkinella soli]